MIDSAAVLAEAAAESGVAGAQLAVAGPGGLTAHAVGWADAAEHRPLTDDGILQLGSISKPLVALAALRLAEQGRLDPDAPLAATVPAFAPRDPAARAITARHVMSMSSGLDTGPYVTGDDVDGYLRLVADDPLLFAPGEAFAYSGVGIVLLARALEHLTSLAWHAAVAQLVLGPAGLDGIRLDGAHRHEPGHRLERSGALITRYDAGDMPAMGPTGTTATGTASDLARLGALLAGDGDGVLAPATLAAVHAPVTPVSAGLIADHWGLGVYHRTIADAAGRPLQIAGHGGRWSDGVCDVVWLPGRRLAYAVATNTPQRAGALIQAVGRRMLPALSGVDDAWPSPAPVAVDRAETRALAGSYTSPAARFEVTPVAEGLQLRVTRHPRPGTVDAWGETDATLAPIGPRRYLPVAEGLDERRLQEVWFSPDGRFVYDGLAAGRRDG
ncbi:MAG: serine hydrolase domain-containing protein [Protaetiibacter sp.]